VIPADAEGLALSMKHTHGRYASYWNVIHNPVGHAWQGRYFSCPLDGPHLWAALRYTELNPVQAQLVTEAHAWAWSSAAVHCAAARADTFLSTELWQNHWTNTSWREYLAAGGTELASIRQCTHTGWPSGTQELVHAWNSRWTGAWFLRKAADPPNRARIQDNQILITAYDEVLSQTFSYNCLMSSELPVRKM